MENLIYENESKIEQSHWWFRARRKMFGSYIAKNIVSKDAKILDVGSSSGTNLRMLKDLGYKNYHGFDKSELSKKFCEEKGLGKVINGDIIDSGLKSEEYDLVIASDIIEHVKDHEKAVQELNRVLKPGSKLLVTVPCFMSLWGDHDETAHHQRRYKIKEIRSLIESNGFKIEKSYYFNFILFLPILFFRKIRKILNLKIKSETSVNNGFLNKILYNIFKIDIFLSKIIKPPFGVSAFIFATKLNNK